MGRSYIDDGSNIGYNRCDTFNLGLGGLLNVVGHNRQGKVGNNYYIRIYYADGSLVNADMMENSIKEFINFTRNERDNSFVITDIPELMTNFRHKSDAIRLFDLSRLKNCYYPYWW